MPWLAASIVLSVVLTVLLNVALRLFPGAGRRAAQSVAKLTWPSTDDTRTSGRRVRLWFPWKAMLLGSLILTVVVNLVLFAAR